MSNYNHMVTFIVPRDQQYNAKKISRSLDPDIGGFEAFETYLSANGETPATHVAYSTPCRESFLQLLEALTADSVTLKAAVDADYSARWQNEVAPSLDECAALLANLQIYIELSMLEAAELAGLFITTKDLE